MGLFFLGKLPYEHSITAPCQLIPVEERNIVAPFDGILEKAFCRRGDFVTSTQLLAKLDGRELQLELYSVQQSLSNMKKKIDLYFAKEKIAEYKMALFQYKQLEARLELVQSKLSQLRIQSSISGIVLHGELDRSFGAPVKTGQLLFVVAPLKKLTVEIAVPEDQISYVKEKMRTVLKLDAYSDDKWGIIIDKNPS